MQVYTPAARTQRDNVMAQMGLIGATADEAKATADTTAASVDEYMDALLGLGTTSGTEANDAE